MADSSGATTAAAKAVQSSPQPGVFRRLLELLLMLVSALLLLFAWDTAGRAEEETSRLRLELRRAKAEQAERSGTRCTVCLDNPREVLIQPCGHVVCPESYEGYHEVLCSSASARTAPRGLPRVGISVLSAGEISPALRGLTFHSTISIWQCDDEATHWSPLNKFRYDIFSSFSV